MTPSLETIRRQEPAPTIVISCEKRPVSGTVGSFELVPRLSFTNMPGGLDTVYRMLVQSLNIVHYNLLEAAAQQRSEHIQVVPTLPGDLVRH